MALDETGSVPPNGSMTRTAKPWRRPADALRFGLGRRQHRFVPKMHAIEIADSNRPAREFGRQTVEARLQPEAGGGLRCHDRKSGM